jgi:hypothetical protein
MMEPNVFLIVKFLIDTAVRLAQIGMPPGGGLPE